MNHNVENQIISSLDDSFFKEAGKETQVEECFKTIDDRINYKIAEGLKRGTRLIFQKLNHHISSKMKIMVDEEVDRRIRIHETSELHTKNNNQSLLQSQGTNTIKPDQSNPLTVDPSLLFDPLSLSCPAPLPDMTTTVAEVVSTPQKKDPEQCRPDDLEEGLKVFETVEGGVQTFGRVKVCSEQKSKNLAVCESGKVIDKKIYGTGEVEESIGNSRMSCSSGNEAQKSTTTMTTCVKSSEKPAPNAQASLNHARPSEKKHEKSRKPSTLP